MSAPAPGLAATPRQAVKVRIADAAVVAGCVSLIFSLLLVIFPDHFPNLIVRIWANRGLSVGLFLFAALFNCALYTGIARLRSADTAPLAYAVIGAGTAATVLIFSWVVPAAVVVSQQNLRVRAQEEILFHVYFAVVAAIFFPFLMIRLTQGSARKPAP